MLLRVAIHDVDPITRRVDKGSVDLCPSVSTTAVYTVAMSLGKCTDDLADITGYRPVGREVIPVSWRGTKGQRR